MAFVTSKTKKLELQIDEFLDKILQAGLVFKQGVRYYLRNEKELFNKKLEEVQQLENEADQLRRTIETKLYQHTLIPEQRGDVLGILESSDKVINITHETLSQFSVEIPEFIPEIHSLLIDLTDVSVSALESMVSAIRAYFVEMGVVRDFITKTIFFEKESDKLGEKIKRIIFNTPDLELARKIHQRYFTYHIENIADAAEDVCDRLAIAVIKRYG